MDTEAPRTLISSALDLLFPKMCCGCGRYGAYLCPRCLPPISTASLCPRCGLPAAEGRVHSGCRAALRFDGFIAAGHYQGALAAAIKQYKYEFVSDIADTLGALLASATRDTLPDSIRVIVPVPLHPSRQRWRGFNQAELLARSLGRRIGLPVVSGLRRVRPTVPQVSLSAEARRQNISGAFVANQPGLTGGVGLVDDVATTTATLSECARVLAASGAGPIWGLVVARD